jgi:uncharacterized protein (TIGR02246 family)
MSVEQSVKRIVEDLVEAWNRCDGAWFSRLFAENADYVTGTGVRLAGRGQIRDLLFTRAPGSLGSGRVAFVTESIKPLGPDAAVILCAWHMDPGDARPIDESSVRRGVVTIVTQRTGGTWHIIALHNTDSTQ